MTMPELMEHKTEQLKRAYAEFIDIAAHDLDAPLRKLSVLIERVTADIKNDESLQPYINRIFGCIQDMRGIIDGLALLSRTITETADKKPVDTGKLLNEIKEELGQVHKNRVITLEHKNMPVIEGDERQLGLLFRNLIENSIRFNTNPVANITVTSNKSEPAELVEKGMDGSRETAKIIITDNGIGFRPEFAKKIFEPFVRLHGKSDYPGKGLGLSICKRITENHNGTIYALGNENEGARFVLLLPYKLS
jgi:light-regulated signal transduction histidine kinase (bacteriophytochrome)